MLLDVILSFGCRTVTESSRDGRDTTLRDLLGVMTGVVVAGDADADEVVSIGFGFCCFG